MTVSMPSHRLTIINCVLRMTDDTVKNPHWLNKSKQAEENTPLRKEAEVLLKMREGERLGSQSSASQGRREESDGERVESGEQRLPSCRGPGSPD